MPGNLAEDEAKQMGLLKKRWKPIRFQGNSFQWQIPNAKM